MVVKKVRNPYKAASPAGRIHRLADYIGPPETVVSPEVAQAGRVERFTDDRQRPPAREAREKCIHSGARGFLASGRNAQKAEMLALALASVHSKDPISHYVLSWRTGEQPTPPQIEVAVDLFLNELGLSGHQVFYGLHVDTDHIHLHVMINRVHPWTFKVIQSHQGFDLEAAHRAIARIEHAQGWRREEHGRYRVQDNGQVRRERYAQQREPSGNSRRTRVRDARGGALTAGAKSAEQIAIEEGAPLIRQATGWEALHEGLAMVGMRYERQGSGALLWVGKVAVKASRAGRDCSRRAVEQRLGDYRPALSPRAVAPPHDDRRALRDRQNAERQALSAAHREQREALWSSVPPGGWRGRGAALNAHRRQLAARQAAERAALRERQQQERAALRAGERGDFPADGEGRRKPALPEEPHRQRARLLAGVAVEESTPALQAHDIPVFIAIIYGRRVDYRRQDAANGLPGFVDRGREIVVFAETDQETVLAALQLATQKWGAFQIEGDAAYQARCVSLAAEYGLPLRSPDQPAALPPTGDRLGPGVSRPGPDAPLP